MVYHIPIDINISSGSLYFLFSSKSSSSSRLSKPSLSPSKPYEKSFLSPLLRLLENTLLIAHNGIFRTIPSASLSLSRKRSVLHSKQNAFVPILNQSSHELYLCHNVAPQTILEFSFELHKGVHVFNMVLGRFGCQPYGYSDLQNLFKKAPAKSKPLALSFLPINRNQIIRFILI